MTENLPNNKKLIPISEAAKILGVSIDTIRRWDKSGILHSQRPDGKNRYFSVSELGNVKFSRPLSIGEAATQLGMSTSTLRRLEKKGLIGAERNGNGERVYDKKALGKFLNSEYFLRQKEVQEKILEPLGEKKEEELGREVITQKIVETEVEEVKKEVSFLKRFWQVSVGSGLFIAITFVLIIIIIMIFFFLYPEGTGRFFGYQRLIITGREVSSVQTKNPSVLAAKVEVGNTINGHPVGKVLKPFSRISLSIVKAISPEVYQRAVPAEEIKNVNDIFLQNQGDLITLYPINLPESAYLKVGDSGLIENLNAQYLQAHEPGTGAGDLVVVSQSGQIDSSLIPSTTQTISSTLIDLSSVTHSSTSIQGLILPNASSSSPSNPSSGQGYLAYDTAGKQLIFYNGSSWSTISAGSSSSGSSSWSALTAPSAALALTMGGYSSTFTYSASTGTTSLYKLIDTLSNTGTGYILDVETATGSTAKPLKIVTAGNAVIDTTAAGNVVLGNSTAGDIQFGKFGAAKQNGVLYLSDTSGTLAVTDTGTSGPLCLISTGGGAPAWGSCSGATSTAWSSLTTPVQDLPLSMGNWHTVFTWGAATGASDMFTIQDTTGNTGTGYLLNVGTVGTSAAKPFKLSAKGNTIFDTTAAGNISLGYATGTVALTGTNATLTTGGVLTVGKASTTTGQVVFTNSAAAGTTTLQAGNQGATNITYTWPTAISAGNFLQTDVSGVLSWVAAGGAGCSTCLQQVPTTDAANTVASTTDVLGLLVKQTTTGSPTKNIFAVTDSGGTNFAIKVDQNRAITLSTAAGQALTFTGGATSTWDLGASSTLNLQTTNNGPITTGTGLLTSGGSLTFSGTAARTITGPGTGGLTMTVAAGPVTVSTTGSGTLAVTSAGALSLTGAAASTWTLGSNALTLTASNYSINAAGAHTLAGAQAADITTLAGTAPTALVFQPGNNTTISGTGAALTLKGGNESGTTSTGGNLVLDAGTGTSTNGTISIGTTNSGTITIGRSTQGITLPGFTGNNAVLYATTSTGVLAQATTSTSGLCLLSGAATGYVPTWTTCPGGGSLTVRETDTSPSVSSVTTLEFGPTGDSTADFVVTDQTGGVARVVLGSNVAHINVAETVSGGWTFNTAATTFTTAIDVNSASTIAGLTVDGNGNLSVSNGTLSVAKTAAGAGDIANVSGTSANAIQGLTLALTSTADAGVDAYQGLNITWTESTDADTFTALNIGNTTTANSTTTAISIGTGWDTGISVSSGGITTNSLTSSGAIAANGGITFDAATDTVGAHTLSGTLDASTQIITNIGNIGTDFIATTGALTLAGDLTLTNNTLVCTACIDVTDIGADAVDDSELVNALTYTGALTLTPGTTTDFVVNGDQDSNVQLTNTLTSDATSVNSLDFSTVINAAAGAATVYGVNINQADNAANTAVVDAIVRLQNTNAAETTANGLLIEQTGAGTLTNAVHVLGTAGAITDAVHIEDGAGTIADGIQFTGTFTNLINSANFVVTNAGAVTAASLTSSGAIAANGGITFDQTSDTIGSHTAGGTILMNANILQDIGNTGTDFIASTGALTLAGVLTANGGVTIAGGQNLTLSSGTGTYTQTNAQTTDATADALTLTLSPGGTGSTGTLRGLVISQSDTATTGVFDSLAYITNLKTPETTANGLFIEQNAASGTLTNGLNITSTAGTLANAINIVDGAGTITTGLTMSGTFTNLIDTPNFDVSNAGAVTAVGVNSGAGLLQGALGLTITGAAVSLNASSNFAVDIATGTSTGAVSIGGDANTVAIAGTNFDLTTAGVITLTGNLTLSADASEGLSGGGLVDCDVAGTSKLLWDTTTNKFSCGVDQNSGGATAWDAINDPAGAGIVVMGETDQNLDWNMATDVARNALEITMTHDFADTTTQKILVVANLNDALAVGTLETMLSIDNRDINEIVTNGLLVEQTGAGTMTNAINIAQTAGTITNGILFTGAIANDITSAAATDITMVTGTTGVLTLDSGTTGVVNLGTGNNIKTINIGTGTAGDTINIGTNNTTKDTINIGSALDDVAITGDQWSITNAGVLTVASCVGCGGATTKYLSADHANSTTTGTKVTSLDTTLAPGTYTFTYSLIVQSTTATTGPMFGINFSTGTAAVHTFAMRWADGSTVLTAYTDNMDDEGTKGLGVIAGMASKTFTTTAPNMGTTVGTTTASSNTPAWIDGILIVTVQGNLELWHSSETTTATTLMANSSLVIQPITAGADLAEIYGTMDTSIEPGDVVSLDAGLHAGVKKSTKAYDANAIGIISTSPSLVMGTMDDPGATPVMVALSGRVPVKVSTENGPIKFGDLLTSSSLPGVAMRATKAGQIIGQAMTPFDGEGVGQVLAFVKTDYGNGAKLADILPGLTTEASLGKQALTYFLSQKDQLLEAGNLSEIVADRIVAGVEIITPKLIADEIEVRRIKAGQIEGLTFLAEQIISEKFIQAQNVLGSQTATESGEIVPTETNLTIDSLLTNKGLTVLGPAEFRAEVLFAGLVNFEITPIFNKNTAGFAVVKQGGHEVEVLFEKEYIQKPIVNASPIWDVDQATLDVIKQLGTYVLPKQDFIITNITTKGFTILLDVPAVTDLKFSWIALAVKDAKTFESGIAPTPTPMASPSPTPTSTVSPSASPTATPMQTLTVNSPDLGFVRLRAGPDTTSAELDQIPTGTILNYTDVQNNWYQVSYNGQTGWISGDYVILQ